MKSTLHRAFDFLKNPHSLWHSHSSSGSPTKRLLAKTLNTSLNTPLDEKGCAMNQKALTLATLTATMLALSACSSSGGGGGSSFNSTTTSPATPTVTTTNSSIQGNIRPLTSQGVARANTTTTATTAVNKLVIDGKTIDFIPQGFSANSINITANNQARIGGSSNLAYTRYGYVKEGANGTPYLFSQGQVTATMPTTGTAVYTGNATHVVSDTTTPRITQHNARFNVDYGKKTVTGTIFSTNQVGLNATISGNKFSGTSTQGYRTDGYFYGNDAAELGGTYSNASGTISGAYGAKK